MATAQRKMLTAKEVARRLGAGESSIRKWAKEGRFAGAKLEESPIGPYWLIPERSLDGFVVPGIGRPPKAKREDSPAGTSHDRKPKL